MRKILMVGTHLAQPPYFTGVEVFVPEALAYTLAGTGELAYADQRDAVTAAHAALLRGQVRAHAVRQWAERRGEQDLATAGEYILPPGPDEPREAGYPIRRQDRYNA